MGLLDNKVILVTGGTSGIGRASAELFAQEGAQVALTGRRAAEGEEVVAGIRKAGGTAVFIQADLTRIETIPDIINRTVANFGRLDGAFNNAGVSGGGPIETLDEATWDRIVDTNLRPASSRCRHRWRSSRSRAAAVRLCSTARCWHRSQLPAPRSTAPAKVASMPSPALPRWSWAPSTSG